MLDAREARADMQRRLTDEYGLPLICFTMNIAGEVKDSPLIRLMFNEGVRRLRALPYDIRYALVQHGITGPTAYFVLSGGAQELKRAAVMIEDAHPAFRLFDIDVMDADGRKLSRSAARRCMVCQGPAKECARSRAHGLDAVKGAQDGLLKCFAAEYLGRLAARALTVEVEATPKPGLVDAANNGAHNDMDISTFRASIAALEPYFTKFALSGLKHGQTGGLMPELVQTGIEAECAMLSATGGVNTHRGAIYSLGLLLAAAGIRFASACDLSITELAAQLASLDIKTRPDAADTHGAAVRRNYGVTGVRGEAASGFRLALTAAELFSGYSSRMDEHAAAVLTLPHIMAGLTDTNLLHRGGEEGLSYVKAGSAAICALDERDRPGALKRMDGECIKRNLSPGGSADMLGLAIFLSLCGPLFQNAAERFPMRRFGPPD